MVTYKKCDFCGIPRAILVKCVSCGKKACKDCVQIKDFTCKDCLTKKIKNEYNDYADLPKTIQEYIIG